jgi:hypothetical protein
VMTFYGQAVPDVEIDLRLSAGSFMGHWPAAQPKSGRLRWLDTALVSKLDDPAQLAFVPAEHWFQQARREDALYVKKGARLERFIAYDAILNMSTPIRLQGGPDKYQVSNAGNYPLADLMIAVPTPEGRRIGWIDSIGSASEAKPAAPPLASTADQTKTPKAEKPAEKAADEKKTEASPTAPAAQAPKAPEATAKLPTVEVALSGPLKEGSPELAAATTASLAERLKKTGLKPLQIELLMAQYAPAIFATDSMVVVYRLPSSFLDEKVPLTFYPEPSKINRVGLMIVTNIDPKIGSDITNLVAKLGDPQYKEREAASKRLAELGPLAYPALKEALRNTDLEIAMRAERILLNQNQSIDVPDAKKAAEAVGNAVRGVIQAIAK